VAGKSDRPSLADALEKLKRKYGPGSIAPASEAPALKWKRIRTDCYAFDYLSGGGCPHGVPIMLYGSEGSAKSTVAAKICIAAQRHCRECVEEMLVTEGKTWNRCPLCGWRDTDESGVEVCTQKHCGGQMVVGASPQMACPSCKKHLPYRVLWMDEETSFTTPWFASHGGDASLIYVSRPETAEEAVDGSMVLLATGEFDLVVVDTIAQMVPKKELEESMESWQTGLQARLVNKALRGWTSKMAEAGVIDDQRLTMILINQIRYKIGVMFGDPTTKPGGKGQDFAPALTIKMWTGKVEKDELGNTQAAIYQMSVEKNKTAPTTRMSGNFRMWLRDSVDEDGVDRRAWDTEDDHVLLEYGLAYGVVNYDNKKYTLNGQEFRSQTAVQEYLRTDVHARKWVADALAHKRIGEVWFSLKAAEKSRKKKAAEA